MIFILSLLLIIFTIWPSLNNRQFYEAYLGLSFLIIILSKELFYRIHWSIGIIFGLMGLSALTGFFFPTYYPIKIDQIILARGGSEILYSLVGLILFAILLLTQTKKFFITILWLLFFTAVLNAAVMLITSQEYGILGNKAQDASFIACMLPMALHKMRKKLSYLFSVVMIAGILFTKSSTGLAGIGVAIAAILFQKLNIRKFISIVTPLTILIIGFGYFFLGDDLLFHSGRKYVYANAWEFYTNYVNHWLGAGTGSFTIWGIAYQKMAKLPELWIWLHNDYLEVLFENGIIGLGLFGIVGFYTLHRLYAKRAIEFPIAIVYGFTALTQMPIRLWVTQLLGVCLLARAFKDET